MSSIRAEIETSYSSEQGLVIGLDGRTAFTSLIAGDGEATVRMFEAAGDYAQNNMYEYFTDSEFGEDYEPGREVGILWNSVGFGMADAVGDRIDSHNADIMNWNKNKGYVVDMMAAGIPEALAAEPVKMFLKEMFTEEQLNSRDMNPPSNEQMYNNISSRLDAILLDTALEAFYDSTDGGHIPDEMVDENGVFIRDWGEWSSGDHETRPLRDNAWTEVEQEDMPVPLGSSDVGTHFNHFMGAMKGVMGIS